MEEGTLAKWLVKPGDTVSSGDIMAEIETDKATMEFEAVDEGTLASILIDEGTENVAVGTVIAMLAEDGEDLGNVGAPDGKAQDGPAPLSQGHSGSSSETTNAARLPNVTPVARRLAAASGVDLTSIEGSGPRGKIIKADITSAMGSLDAAPATAPATSASASAPPTRNGERIIASPLAKRIAGEKGITLGEVSGTGPGGRIIERDVENFVPAPKVETPASTSAPSAGSVPEFGAPYEEEKVSSVRKVIARRLTESKNTVPHYYLTMDIRLDPLLALRAELNAALEPDGVKLSVNDLLIKALAKALIRVPHCNVSFHGETMRRYTRADISVAVAAPSGLITPVITEADTKSLAVISTEMKALATKARDGKLMPHEYQGGTASLSNLGMYGIKQFDAVINPPQGMILAVGAGQKAPYVIDGELGVATVMHASGSFDHRAIDGADGAQLMEAVKQNVENPLGLVV